VSENTRPTDASTVAVRAVVSPAESPNTGIQWRGLLKGSMNYLAVMHAFRITTEKGTREGLHNSIAGGYFKALGAMHGWSDGDGLL